VFWKSAGDSFEGVQNAETCHYMPPGMSEKIRLSDRIVLSPAAMTTNTKMMRKDGSLVQGNPLNLPEVSYKARAFSCFLIVRNPDQPNGYERYNDLALNDQGGEVTITTKHKEPLKINVWMLNLATRVAGARPTLMMYAKEENTKFERVGAFGSADASRLAVVAGFGEANCTLAK
jgi:hypothetical protein